MSYRVIPVELYAKVAIDEDDIEQAVENKECDGEKIEDEKDAIFWLVAAKIRANEFDVKDWDIVKNLA